MVDSAASQGAAPRVLVAGIAVLDYVFKVDQFPTEPSKYLTHDLAVSLGGCAANAALAVAKLGGRSALTTRLGDDSVADQITEILRAVGVDLELVRRFPACRSSVSSIFVDDRGERLIVHFRDADLSSDADWLRESVAAEIFHDVGAILADTRWPDGATASMALAQERKIPGVLDVEANDQGLREAYQCASHIAFSAEGLRDYTGNPSRESALRLANRTVPAWVCVTDGGEGVFYMRDNDFMHVPAFEVKAVDTLGAGDVWHGAFALRLAEGADELQAIYFANAVAAIKCTRFGGTLGTPGRDEVERFLATTTLPEPVRAGSD